MNVKFTRMNLATKLYTKWSMVCLFSIHEQLSIKHFVTVGQGAPKVLW